LHFALQPADVPRVECSVERKSKMKKLMAVVALAMTPALVLASSSTNLTPLENKVRHEIVMLPYLGVFDNVSFRVDNGVVTLFGQVTRPTLKSDAANVVKRLEGVSRVENKIEVLPLSGFDNSIRAREYRTIFGSGSLYRYAMGTNPSIRIIVKNGHVTLEGVVSSEGDRNWRASAPTAFRACSA
jgi:hyperosmotically inducible protein